MKAVRIETTGGPEVLRLVDVPRPVPGAGEILIAQEAVGLNFIDTYQRSGLYPVKLPSGLGLEGAGVVEAVGEGVTRFRPGDRAAYCTGPLGAYAEAHAVPAGRAVRVPDGITSELAAAGLLKGLTAQFLLRSCHAVQPGETILVHAAAGGVGLILCQWAKALGATVIGTAGSEAKAALAREHGCDHVILYRREDVAARVREITGGAGVPVVYDSVGKDTFMASIDSLAPRGLMVSFGNASGPVGPIDPLLLSAKGSLYLTRPTLFHYASTTAALDRIASEFFAVLGDGRVRVAIHQRFGLSEIVRAHEALEARATQGASVLDPGR